MIWWHDSKSVFIEKDSVIHTQEKCKMIKKSAPKEEITLKTIHSILDSLDMTQL